MRVLVSALLVGVAAAKCANDCSGNGYCNQFSACECYRNWMGNDCSRRVCYFGRAFVDTPQGDLNSNGVLDSYPVDSRATSKSTFEGFPLSYAGGADDVTTWSEAHFYAECSNKGVCDRSTGLCECWPGYEGSGCTRVACPSATAETCSGHGTCNTLSASADADHAYNGWDQDKTQACDCDPGYMGIDCSQRACPSGDDPITKYVKLTTLCLEKETQPTATVHQNNMPVADAATLGTARKEVYGHKSGAKGTMVTRSGWSKIENGVTSTLAETPGCIYLTDVEGEFVVGDKVMRTDDGTALRSASHTDEELIVREITRATYTNTAQTVEKQTIKFKPYKAQGHTFANGVDGPSGTKFALTFKDEFGQSYTTRTILTGMAEPATIKSLMDDIEAALEELPNQVLPNVKLYMRASQTESVAGATGGSSATCTGTATAVAASCTGTATDGTSTCDLDAGTDGSAACPAGCTEVTAHTPTCDLDASTDSSASCPDGCTETAAAAQYAACPSDGEFPTGGVVTDGVGNVKFVSGFNTAGLYTAANDANANGALTTASAICDYFAFDIEFVSNTGNIPTLEVYGPTGDDGENFYDVTMSTTTEGTTENLPCANRGLCDHATGTCKCYPGFTGHDCAKQNVLAMF